MAQSPITEALPKRDTSTQSRLRGPWLFAARVAWVVFAAFSIGLFLWQVPSFVRGLQTFEPRAYQLEWTQLDLLAAIDSAGVSREFIVSLYLLTSLLTLVAFWFTSILMFWLRSDEWLGLITAYIFMGVATGFASIDWELPDLPALIGGVFLFVNTMVWPTFMTFFYLFPNGQFVPRWSKFLAVFIYSMFLIGFVFWPNQPGPDWVGFVIFGVVVSGVGSQIYRYRRVSTPTQRQQAKLLVYGIGAWITYWAIGLVGDLAFPIVLEPGAPGVYFGMITNRLLGMTILAIPISIAVSLIRYRLWDVDFIINRSLVLGIMALLFIILAAGSLFGISQLATNLPGGPLVGVAVGAAIFGVAFTPVYKECQRYVDRLYGIKLDYVAAVKAYGGTKREAVKAAKPDTLTSFGSYKGLTLLGRGGMGEVYRGAHPTLNRSVAIKILPDRHLADSDAQKRFEREAQTIAKLKHPNIITLYDVGEQNNTPFMVMEYIDGKDLSDLIRERGRLPLDEALPILTDIAAALDYAHSQGVIHRDIKPSNVMIEKVTATGSGKTTRAVLMDFGIAKSYAAGTKLTQTGMIGTLDYISPEQIQGAAEVDARADIYSFGVMAYQTLTGKLPFIHNNPGAMVLAHLNQPAPDAREIVPDVPETAALAVMKTMAKKPEDRFGTAGEFVTALHT